MLKNVGSKRDCKNICQEPPVNITAFIVWAFAVVAGYCASQDIFFLTGFSAINSILVASFSYYLLKVALQRW